MEVEIGKDYKTYGGWWARVIWVVSNDIQKGFYAVHKYDTDLESVPIYHWENGTAHSVLAVNEPPIYDSHHPADFIREGE